MIKNKKIVALVPLRGGSKSIPGKNIKMMAGKPLAYWALSAAAASKYIDEVWVSTEDPKIKKTVLGFGLGIKVLDRPKEMAQDDSSTESVMLHFAKEVPFDFLVTIQATSPLTTEADLDAAIEQFTEKNHDSLLTGILCKKFYWAKEGKPLNYDYHNRPRRQEFAGVINENGAFYITKRQTLEKEKNRLGGKIGIYEMPEEKAVDIDGSADWKMAERQLKELLRAGEKKL